MVNKKLPHIYTDKQFTPWGGLLLVKEFYDPIGMGEYLSRLPFIEKGSGRRIDHHEIIESFLMSIILGANNCSSSARLWCDDVVKEIFQRRHGMPSQSTLSRLVLKYDSALSDELFSRSNRWWLSQLEYAHLTFDRDNTVITRFGNQQGAEVGYNPRNKERKSHHPTIMAFLAEPRMVVNSWIRAGNCASNTAFEEFLNNTFEMIPCEQITLLRGDSGFCSNRIFKYLEERGLPYIISAPMRAGLVDKILSQKNWIVSSVKRMDVCSIKYRAKGWGKMRRVVLIREDTSITPAKTGKTLVSKQDDYLRHRYSALLTTSNYSDELVWRTYNQRAEAANHNKELKYDYYIAGFNLRDEWATEFAFRWVTIAYNLMSYIRNGIMVSKVSHTLSSTIRFNFTTIGAYLATSSRRTTLVLVAKGKNRDYLGGLFQRNDRFKPTNIASIA